MGTLVVFDCCQFFVRLHEAAGGPAAGGSGAKLGHAEGAGGRGCAQRGGAGAAKQGPAPAGQSPSPSHRSRPGVAGADSVTEAMPPAGGHGSASVGALNSGCQLKGVVEW